MQNRRVNPTGKEPQQRSGSQTSGYTGADSATTAPDQAKEAVKNTVEQAKSTVDQAKQKASEVTDQAKQKAAETTEEVRHQVKSRLDERTNEAAGRLGGVAQALHRTSEELHEQDERLMAEYTGVAADQVEQFSHYLQEHSAGDLLHEVRRFAERQPEIFVAGALAAGFMVGRFLKSEPPHQREQSRYSSEYRQSEDTYPYRANYRSYESGEPSWGQQSPGGAYSTRTGGSEHYRRDTGDT